MSKPTVFFSHSSRDQQELARLKELFVAKTGGSIDVFLSSDGQSIPLGRNWVHQIQEALNHASLMIVFVSPQSLTSNWLFFESGFAYAKDIRVVPVGFLGVDLGNLHPPLTLLQGFNITSEAGLNNLIALANEEFRHSHEESFTPEEFRGIYATSATHSTGTFGDFAKFIDQVEIQLSPALGLTVSAADAIKQLVFFFDREGLEYEHSDKATHLHGLSFSVDSARSTPTVKIAIDPSLADVTFPIVERAIREVRTEGIAGVKISIRFGRAVACLRDSHKITGRLYGTDVKLSTGELLIRKDIRFSIGRLIWFSERIREGEAYINMELLRDQIPKEQIKELFSLLFDKGILFFESDVIRYIEY